MVKITIDNDGTKAELTGKCIFAVVIDPEGEGDMASALMGSTSPCELADAAGKCLGAQIKTLAPNFIDQVKLLDILAKSTARGIYGDVQAVKKEVGPERKENDE